MTVLQESKRQLIGLAFTVAAVVVVTVVGRAMDDPDAMRSLKMRGARYVSARSDRAALLFLNLSDRAERVYENGR